MFRFETEVDKARRILLGQLLKDTNTEASSVLRALRGTPDEKELPLHVWVMDDKGGLAGGLTGRTWASWLHVDLLWVDAAHRGAGLGGQLLARAEESARTERSCAFSRVETWDFQAPDFYRKQGYEVVGEVPDYPPGVTEFILAKRL
ncbi:biotin transporter BioY [Streptomyces sp. ERV7]|uniref:GNAT family N-acetyltransferase n=1 Tax=Streptomyces sp. ERV7 TaxID=1322334 RepID=UPI0007F3B1C6|nr:GNAT family N-acetyltransferase [Streptomyces sp. ERV7]OAR26160.1 biotin transporter BioY [Streptomyces sp. ERV7]